MVISLFVFYEILTFKSITTKKNKSKMEYFQLKKTRKKENDSVTPKKYNKKIIKINSFESRKVRHNFQTGNSLPNISKQKKSRSIILNV